MISAIILASVGVLIYQMLKPPAPKICGSPNGPPVTSPRIKLRDGRYLAYKERGAARGNSKFSVILFHDFFASKETYIPLSDALIFRNQEVFTVSLYDKVTDANANGICIITFDRPGYAESDPNPNRSPKNDAFDIQDLADQLELGPKFYIIGLSISCYAVWACLKYIPHRLAGVVLVVPVVNYWWPSLPSELCAKAYEKLPRLDQWRLQIAHHTPKLAWILQKWFPFPTVDIVRKNNPKAFNKSDLMIIEALSKLPAPDKDMIDQQGVYESGHRDIVVSYGDWGFDPLELSNPIPDNSRPVQCWIGSEDGIIAVELQRHITERLPWIQRHEVPYGGHLFIHDPKVCEMMFKSLLFGEHPCFD